MNKIHKEIVKNYNFPYDGLITKKKRILKKKKIIIGSKNNFPNLLVGKNCPPPSNGKLLLSDKLRESEKK